MNKPDNADRNNADWQMTMESRNHLLENIKNARQLVRLTGDTLETTGEQERANIAYENAIGQLMELNLKYESGLPRVNLSRCPFTGELLSLAVDTFGFDGPWWDAEAGTRPVEPALPTLFAYTGAVQLEGTVPITPFLCKPGPEQPFVNPRLLSEPNIKAVISTIRIGGQRAFFIAYYSENTPFDILRINSWGLNYYYAEDAYGGGYQGKSFDTEYEYDFNLGPWISRGKLLWIEQEDISLRLHSTFRQCQYLNLEGRKYPVGLFNGEKWNSLIELPPEPAGDLED